MHRSAKNLLLFVMAATFASGCYFDVSSDSNKTTGSTSAEELAFKIEAHFALKAGGATADIVCPAGLSGKAGGQLTCTGTTSDGYTLEILVLERGKGAFRWDVVNSVPIARVKTQEHPATKVSTNSEASVRTKMRTEVETTKDRRCIRDETGYVCIED